MSDVTVIDEHQTVVIVEDGEDAQAVVDPAAVQTVAVVDAARATVVVTEGMPGPPGPTGPPGSGGASAGYSHHQAAPASTWAVAHLLGYKPGGVTAYDSDGRQIEGVVEHIDVDNLRIHFSSSFSGEAEVS